MKKILYTLLMVSLFSVACTEEVLVSRDHDLDAEIAEIETKMTMKTLYCNINESVAVELGQLGSYLTAKDADVVKLVAPATVSGESFVSWLEGYAAETGYMAMSRTNKNGKLVMAALVKNAYSEVTAEYVVREDPPLNNAVLLFSVDKFYFVVTEMNKARNAIPSDWEEQVAAMLKNHKTVPLVYDPDQLAERQAEMDYLIDQTLDNEKFSSVKYWVWSLDTNAPSNIDMKYGKEFKLVDCYDNVDEEAFIKKHHSYFAVSEYLSADDAYFKVNDMLVYAGMVDCLAVQHSVYTPSSGDGNRHNFLYTSDDVWNIIQSIELDKSVEWNAMHYPIVVTLKEEE